MNYVIGDIHGCYHALVKLIDKIRSADSSAKPIFIGDYVDRGWKNREVIDYVIALQQEGAVCLRGNHDNVIDWILNKHYMGEISNVGPARPTDESVVCWWLQNGLLQTLASYGISLDKYLRVSGTYGSYYDLNQVAQDFQERCPEEHKNFFRNLPMFWENETHFACHGFFRPDQPLPRDFRFVKKDLYDEILWDRFSANRHGGLYPVVTVWDRIGVFGHTPVQSYGAVTPIKWDKIRLIDCGVNNGNYLCGYCCETDDWILQPADERDSLSGIVTSPVDLE